MATFDASTSSKVSLARANNAKEWKLRFNPCQDSFPKSVMTKIKNKGKLGKTSKPRKNNVVKTEPVVKVKTE